MKAKRLWEYQSIKARLLDYFKGRISRGGKFNPEKIFSPEMAAYVLLSRLENSFQEPDARERVIVERCGRLAVSLERSEPVEELNALLWLLVVEDMPDEAFREFYGATASLSAWHVETDSLDSLRAELEEAWNTYRRFGRQADRYEEAVLIADAHELLNQENPKNRETQENMRKLFWTRDFSAKCFRWTKGKF